MTASNPQALKFTLVLDTRAALPGPEGLGLRPETGQKGFAATTASGADRDRQPQLLPLAAASPQPQGGVDPLPAPTRQPHCVAPAPSGRSPRASFAQAGQPRRVTSFRPQARP
jgi:hypothetical protein